MQSELNTDLQKIAWDNYVQHRDKKNRIEALRAASRICAGIVKVNGANLQINNKTVTPYDWTINVAEHIARWIETGKH